MKRVIFILLLTVCVTAVWCQNRQKLDSIKGLLQDQIGVEESIALYSQLFDAYLYSYPDSANTYRAHIKRLSKEHNVMNGLYLFHSLGGRYHFAKSDLDSAFFHIESASKIAHELQNKAYLADCYKKIGVIYNIQRNDSLAKKYALLALENAKQTDDWRTLSSIYVLLGNRSFQLDEYPEALTHYLKLDSIYSSRNELDKSLAAAYTNIGMIYTELRNPEAVDYIQKSIEVYRTLGQEEGVYYGEVALGTYYDLLKDDRKAIEHLQNARGFYEGYGDMRILGRIYGRLGSAYLQLNDFENAEHYLLKAWDIPQKSWQTVEEVSYQTNLGDLYLHKNEHKKAIFHFNRALELITDGNKDQAMRLLHVTVYKGLYETYKDLKDYENALITLEKLRTLESSIQESQNLVEVEELNKKYQNEKKQQEIELLTSQSQLAGQKAKNQRNLFIAGMSVLGLALISLFVLFRNKQKTNTRLRELEAAKSKFFANISHEFRTPLTLISGPVAHQLSKKTLSSDDKTDLGLIQRNANRLLNLVDQILDLSRIEAGRRKLRVSRGDLELFFKHLIEPFDYQASQKGMVLTTQIDIPGEVWFDREVVEKVITNLLSNALKYNRNKGQISFEAQLQEEEVLLKMVNENEALTESELPKLFDRFYQNTSLNQGFGIGLSLVKELVNLSKGRIMAFKPDPQTIAFEVSLPVSKSTFSKEQFVSEEDLHLVHDHGEMELNETGIGEDELADNNLPVLLIVDDNAEIRLFIKTLFKKEYQLLEAENGEEGVEMALKTIPDLIISDIMMPGRDGIYLSNTLKGDERTSHIPIVLLTAKSGEENELTGLKTGADAYMVKPFKEEKLRVVIEKLIATREAIREKLRKQVILKPKEIALTDADTQLVDRIQQILDSHLTDPEFSAQSFSNEVGLSRMHLHRKLKALTGLSTSEFIRTQRLKLAAKLLTENNVNISEVGYAVGFNQPAYFSTTFKKHFGCSPSDYVER